jgi:osmotically-inducible protein OsmY
MKNIFIILFIASSLQGCFLAGAAAGAAGIAAVYDHRKLEQIADDQKITKTIYDKYRDNRQLAAETTHIDITTFNGVVLLTGQTVTPSLVKQADEIAHAVPGVKRVYNQVVVKGPSSSLTRTSDTWITAKIKTQMLATKGLASGSIKVVTENGTVYLMGIVTHEQADISVEIARQISGVQRVIKVFQYRN